MSHSKPRLGFSSLLSRSLALTSRNMGGWAGGFLLGLVLAACGRSDYATPCASDSECGEGAVCTPEGVCVAIEAECVLDSECDAGEKCLDYKCVEPQVCDDNLECPPGQLCVRDNPDDDLGVCQGDTSCPACPAGTECNGNGQCVPIPPGPCEFDFECPDGQQCIDGVCSGSQMCVEDFECPQGQQCIDGVCVDQFFCQNDFECDFGEICVDGSCVPDNGFCQFDSDCDFGQICLNNFCTDPDRKSVV